ncbi:McrB family protein [Chryseobacterium daecheongense]|uniref:Dynein-related subfamily AAA family protein n=2 Tax=Chryseobacterium daecheongense TaxID=192389 RepID=A0ABY2FYG4_9FLAO|nr:AAA family ATPase [Chryseobacterium daecheongense]TDX94824.1 dynein-related subfamily AAA family protein [Chryseobacterium daecheongense]
MKGYYKLQIRHGETEKNHVDEVIADNRITSHIDYAGPGFEKLNHGDVLLIHKGSYPHCLVEVVHKITDPEEINGVDFGINYRIKVLSYFKDLDDSLSFKEKNRQIGFNGTLTPLYNNTDTLSFIKQWLSYIHHTEKMKNSIELLKYKKQIILQGPPGTGKTKLAKEIADTILNTGKEGVTPKSLIEKFFKDENEQTADNAGYEKKLQEFQKAFPKDQFQNMELDDYCIGKGNRTNFCWWLERGLERYGKFTPGQSGNYVIYYGRSEEDYVVKKSDERIYTLFPKLMNVLDKLINNKDIETALQLYGESFVLKVLNSYYPEEFFPINGKKALENAVKILGRDYKGKSAVELNGILREEFIKLKSKFNSKATPLDFMAFLFKTFSLNQDGVIMRNSEAEIIKREPTIIQFHPSYTYEDFVRGIIADATDKGIAYKVENKVLASLAKEANENPYSDYVLIIDEINRANLSSVLGELIYALEYRGEAVNSVYALKNESDDNHELIIPPNLYIIGTMNTADRSVGHIDYAIRRRFAFVNIPPRDLQDDDKIYFNTTGFNIISALFNKDNVSREFEIESVKIGHSYFIVKKSDAPDEIRRDELFRMKMEYEVKPILLEYERDGILIGEYENKPIKEFITEHL